VSSSSGAITSPIDTLLCDAKRCALAESLGALATFRDGDGTDHARCFALGWWVGDSSREGLLLGCAGGWERMLPVPEAASVAASEASGGKEVPLAIAADRAQERLVAASSRATLAWAYLDPASPPLALPPPAADLEGYGTAVALLSLPGGALAVVTAPGAETALLYRLGDGAAEQVGCLQGVQGAPGTLAAGDVDGDGLEDLAFTSTEGSVRLLSGQSLQALTAADAACGGAWAAGAELAAFECRDAEGLTGCESAQFGASVAVADLQGDGRSEVVVGVPGAHAGSRRAAGGAMVFELSDPAEVSDTYRVSSASAGARYGTSLAAVRVGERDVLALGGAGTVAVAYCSALVPDTDALSRCH